ncbi:hypothetical protein [Cellulomonas marina]|uniref:Uncharacterized protein n=1 Tax=Cellulomonas marina TaxID=988821 RepID=A0A1I1A288_9CELL|nr:hypothetical protein [Cellulomonas marina]GIG29465.1 hypothetical protein Cma02nite_20650 [Cellulomonas marina]SFB30690.1 hypothetical protein SAMN05421867_113106 [Cellulomonas marina]
MLVVLWLAAASVGTLAVVEVRGTLALLGACVTAVVACAAWALVAPAPTALVALASATGLAVACVWQLHALASAAPVPDEVLSPVL